MSKGKKDPFRPFIAAEQRLPELTLRALTIGILLGVFFGVGNVYLGLKVGTTVSASIPAAVISMSILRLFRQQQSTILESNIVQTIASVGEALAGGVIFTVPALFLLGDRPAWHRIFLLSVLGGILGILFMIPMRRYIIVKEHGRLPFPEGTACAEILKSDQEGAEGALVALLGIVLSAGYKVLMQTLRLWQDIAVWAVPFLSPLEVRLETTPALLGVGYIIGLKTAAVILSGGILGWWVLIPLIRIFASETEIIYPATEVVAAMSNAQIWSSYIRYIGAGAVAAGGILSLFRILPIIYRTFHIGFQELLSNDSEQRQRTDQDISLRWLVLGSLALILALWLIPELKMNFVTILLFVLLGFFFVGVTSLTVGVVGSSSNPVSGMTLTTLMITCLVFLALRWTDQAYLLAAISMGCVINIAIALAGATSQDLKTGYLLGATPRLQQISEIIGIVFPALAIGGTLYLLENAYGFGSRELPAPQATLMALLAKGVMYGNIPLPFVLVGACIGGIVAMLGVPVLPFAIGLYLPLSLSMGTMVGGLASFFAQLCAPGADSQQRGTLLSSGLIAGDACVGVIFALLTVVGTLSTAEGPTVLGAAASMLPFLLLAAVLSLLACWPLFAKAPAKR